MPDGNFVIQRVTVEEILALRAAVLRPGLPLSASRMDGDYSPGTLHLAGYAEAEHTSVGDSRRSGPARTPPDSWAPIMSGQARTYIAACLTCLREPYLTGEVAWRLRGMAVGPQYRGHGFGRLMLEELYRRIRRPHGPNLLWCNARASALGFYEKLGWRIDSPAFSVPGIGPQHRMIIRLYPAVPVGRMAVCK